MSHVAHVNALCQCVAVCCSVLQRSAMCCSLLQCVAVCCSVLQCVAVCCSVLQCVAVIVEQSTTYFCMSHVAHVNAFCHTYAKVMPHL